jgi:hypothetical protein
MSTQQAEVLSEAISEEDRPVSGSRRRWWRRSNWGWELLLLIYMGYDGSKLLVSGNAAQAMQHGRDLLSIEQHLHLDPEHGINRFFSQHAWIGIPADFVYASLHYIITVVVLIWIWRRRREHYRSARTTLLVATLLGIVGFVTFPTAPPRLLAESHGFIDILAQHASWGWWGGGTGGTPGGMSAVTNEYAAFPSLHVGWSLWCGVLIWRYANHRVVRVLGLLYPLMIATVVMGTANHYFLDCVAGATVTAIGFLLTEPLLRLWDRMRARLRRS